MDNIMKDKFLSTFTEIKEEFKKVCQTLENHYRDMQDMEFTVEHGKLYMLQTRNGKRTAQAALKIACDLVDEGMRSEEEAVAMIDPRNLDTLVRSQSPQPDTNIRRRSSVAELRLPKPITRVRFPSPAPLRREIVQQ